MMRVRGRILGGATHFAALMLVATLMVAMGLVDAGEAYADGGTIRQANASVRNALSTQAKTPLSDCYVSYISSQDFTGYAIKPEVEIEDFNTDRKLKEGTDYTLVYQNNVNAGTATVKITGKGKYSGTVTESFTIDKAYMWDGVSSSYVSAQVYNGKAHTPEPTLKLGNYTLVKNKDYLLSYEDNVDAGTGYITATGIGNFASSLDISFAIAKAPISSATLSIADQYYDAGYEIEPALSTAVFNGVKLEEYGDYSIAYANNRKVGVATAVVTGNGNFNGTKTILFNIKRRPLVKSDIKDLNVYTYSYTGSPIVPFFYVQSNDSYLREDVDYQVSYADNVKVGTATMTVTGIGGYVGSISVKYKIKKAANPMIVMTYKKSISKSKLKKKARKLSAIKVYYAKGKVTFKKAKKGSSSKLSVKKKTGAIKVKKGTKKGVYKIKVKVKAAGNKNYKAQTQTVKVKVRVK